VLGNCAAVLSGYMGEAALGQVIVDTAARIKAENPDALYCCDPVIGDIGRGIFVRPGIPDFMRQTAVPAADIVTPNQFELSYLTGRDIDTLDHALEACQEVRSFGPKVVLLTSLARKDAAADAIEMLVDTAEGSWLVATPRLDLDPAPNGSGDCVAALFLAHYLEAPDPAQALERATAAIYAIFEATQAAGSRELALIQAQDALVHPPRTFAAAQVRG
jgi:pyridoxine kinase